MIEILLGVGLGLISGYIVSSIAKEELVTGKKYFKIAQWIFFALIVANITYSLFTEKSFISLIIVLIIALLLIIISKLNIYIKESIWISVIIFSSLLIRESSLQQLLSTLTFFYAVLAATLIYIKINYKK